MSLLKCDKVKSSLKKKGVCTVSGRQKHVVYTFCHKGELQAISTHMSHNNQEINDFLQKEMAKQMPLTKSEFIEFIKCNITKEDLIDKYAEMDLIQ
jgi:molybdopterin-guanine dinucleotide biosynthesis protein A